MANIKDETKKATPKKTSTNTNKKTTKTSTATAKKTSSNKTTTAKKTTSKKTTPSKTTKKPSTKKVTTNKKADKNLEKTIIIENIENKIQDIVENYEDEAEEKNVEEIKIEDGARLENAKYTKIKRNKQLLAIGVIISLLGIIALIITLIANRIVDKDFISDKAITIMVIASIIIEIFGAFIIVNES